MSNLVKDLISSAKPNVEMFKLGPEVITDFVGKFVVTMGGRPTDIKSVEITDDKKKLVISVNIEKDSALFKPAPQASGLTLLGGAATYEGGELSPKALAALKELGFRYTNTDKGREVSLYSIEKNKKSFELTLDSELVMAIITNSNYIDPYLFVDASEEVVRRKDYDSKKFKGKKSTVVFAKVQRTYGGTGFDPKQVADRHNGNFAGYGFEMPDDSDED